MGIINIDHFQIIAYALVFLRCLGFFLSWPLFSGGAVPVPLKIFISLLIAFMCFSTIGSETYPKVVHYQSLLGLAVKELVLGLSMGFLTTFIFHAVTIAGELVAMAMGLSSAQVFNPSLNMQQSSVSQLYFFLSAFLFLAIRGHHYFLMGLVESFKTIPLSVILPRLSTLAEFTLIGQKIMEVGLLLSAPVLVSILVINFSMGVMGRAVPQINVLITSLPVNALAGFAILILALPFFLDGLRTQITDFSEVLFAYLKVF